MNQKIHHTRLQLLVKKHSIICQFANSREYSTLLLKPSLLLFDLFSAWFPSYLAHLSDGVIEHSSGIVGSLSDELDLPGSRWKPQLQGIQAHHLLGDLHEDGLARTPSVGVEGRGRQSKF